MYVFIYLFIASQAPEGLRTQLTYRVSSVDIVCYKLLTTGSTHLLFCTGHNFIVFIFYCCFRNNGTISLHKNQNDGN